MILKQLFLFFIIAQPVIASASDIAREKRLADQIIDAIFDGDPVYITDKTHHSFLGIYMPSENNHVNGAAIIMHGRGMHPDWKDVTQPLRTALPEHGWHTLSIQMPVLNKSAKYYDYVDIFSEAGPRIDAAIEFLHKKSINNIVLIAHSCSIHMSMNWLANSNKKNIAAYIGIGMGATDYKQPMKQVLPLSELRMPVLDIFGSADYPAVKKMAKRRLKAMQQAGHAKSDQIMVTNSDHYHQGNNDQLIKDISLWLSKLNN